MFLCNIGKTLNQAPNGVAFKPMKADYLLRNFNYSAVANSTYFFIGSAWWMSYAYFTTIKTAHSHMWYSPLSHVMFIDAGLILLLSASGVLCAVSRALSAWNVPACFTRCMRMSEISAYRIGWSGNVIGALYNYDLALARWMASFYWLQPQTWTVSAVYLYGVVIFKVLKTFNAKLKIDFMFLLPKTRDCWTKEEITRESYM